MKLTTGQVITVCTGYMACDMKEVYQALNYLTGDNLMTHQLVEASKAVEDYVKEECPWVMNLPDRPVLGENSDKKSIVLGWVDQISQSVGYTHTVEAKPELWGVHDPLEDIVKIMNESGRE